MKNTKNLFSALFLLGEKLKGGSRIIEIKDPTSRLNGHLIGRSVAGYEINIFCNRRDLRRVYHKRYIPDKHFILYNVISVVSKDTPIELQKACSLDISIPRLLPFFIVEEAQKAAAIAAYLDLVIARVHYFEENK